MEQKTKNKLLIGCLVSSILIIVLLVLLFVFGMRAFVNFGIASDYKDYIKEVKSASIDTDKKDLLIQRLELLRDNARKGQHLDVLRWVESDEIIRKILHDHVITDPEYNRLIKELNYLQRESMPDEQEHSRHSSCWFNCQQS